MERAEQEVLSVRSAVAGVVRNSLTVTGSLYVTGVVVHMYHLSRYSVPSFELFRLHYFLAGAWAALPVAYVLATTVILVTATRIALADTGRRDPKTHMWKRPTTYNIEGYLAGLSGALALLSTQGTIIVLTERELGERFVGAYMGSALPPAVALALALGIAGSLGVVILGMNSSRREAAMPIVIRSRWNRWLIGTMVGMFVVMMMNYYLAAFAHRAYEKIPSSMGGGSLLNICMEDSEGNCDEESVRLVLETESTLWVRKGSSSTTLAIRKDSVWSWRVVALDRKVPRP